MSTPKYIMGRANRNLSNRADGAQETIVMMNKEAQVATGVANHMTFNVTNNAETDLSLALIPASFQTEEVINTVTTAKVDDTDVVTAIESDLVPSSPAALRNAGYNVGAVLHDTNGKAYRNETTGADVTMSSSDPTRTINEFLRYIKLNPVRVKNMEIYSANANALATNLNITFVNPFFKNAIQSIDLSTFFDLYQYNQNRIKIDFTGNELELSDISLLTCTVPASATMQFIMRFA